SSADQISGIGKNGIRKSASCHECGDASDDSRMHWSRFCNSSKLHGRQSSALTRCQTMVTLINYRSRLLITAREVPDGKSGRLFCRPNYRFDEGSPRRGLGPPSTKATSHNAQDHTRRTHLEIRSQR